MYKASEADGVLGPAYHISETEPPQWVKKEDFSNARHYPTGYRLGWEESRIGNVLFRKNILQWPRYSCSGRLFGTAGEDMDFFRRAMNIGCSFVWCNEAVAYEVVPPSRCTRSYLLNRALLRAATFPSIRSHRVLNVAKSLIAVPCYALVLPILSLFGRIVSSARLVFSIMPVDFLHFSD